MNVKHVVDIIEEIADLKIKIAMHNLGYHKVCDVQRVYNKLRSKKDELTRVLRQIKNT